MKIDRDIMLILARATVRDNQLDLAPLGQLDRATYLRLDKVLKAAGGKWNRSRRVHLFEEPAEDTIERMLETGTIVDRKTELQFFPTDPALAKKLVGYLNVKRDDLCLEPSAGEGAIVRALLEAGGMVVACERDAKMREKLKQVLHPDSIAPYDDFMDMPIDDGDFDVIAANPPFRKVGRGNHLDHVGHAWSMLKDGGRIGFILPASVIFREDERHKKFRAWAEGVGSITRLPDGSFVHAGTQVSTCLFIGEKKAIGGAKRGRKK